MSILLSKIGDYVDGSDQMGKFICPAFNNDRIFSYQKKGDKKKLVESTHKKKSCNVIFKVFPNKQDLRLN